MDIATTGLKIFIIPLVKERGNTMLRRPRGIRSAACSMALNAKWFDMLGYVAGHSRGKDAALRRTA